MEVNLKRGEEWRKEKEYKRNGEADKKKNKNRAGILYTQRFSLSSYLFSLFIDEHKWTAAVKSHPGSENRAGTAPVHLCSWIPWLISGQARENIRPGTGSRPVEAAVNLNRYTSIDTSGQRL